MAFHAQLVVRTSSDCSDADEVRSIISSCAASIERLESGIAADGCKEFEIVVAFKRYRALDEIVREIGEVTGLSVSTVTLLPTRGDPSRSMGAL
jgi:hypothetical protein